MNCDRAIPLLPMAAYGELGDGERHELESHLAECPRCAGEWDEIRRLQVLLASTPSSRRATEEEERLLTQWRADLSAILDREAPPPAPAADCAPVVDAVRGGAGRVWRQPSLRVLMPALAVFLLVAGFGAGWLSHRPLPRPASAPAAGAEAIAPVEPAAAPPEARPAMAEVASLDPDAVLRINSVERVPRGGVRIHFDTVEEHAVTGPSSDPLIRQILLYAVQQPPNSGVRLDSLDLLEGQTQNREVRQALIHVLLHDPNPGVRLKALESLSPQVNRDAAVRQAIVRAVLRDANAGVRSQAVSTLSQASPREAVPLLRQAGDQTSDLYLRLRIAAALRQMQEKVPPHWLDARTVPAITSQ